MSGRAARRDEQHRQRIVGNDTGPLETVGADSRDA
jgi:hypothetical protein